ncbi:MAG: SUF system NifU family Fe-S cluster assembly protein [Atopobiaceae bacterium]|nr:SUF system NifU family Fe-S cluster assembly protein [Atopobiaceae bacterium]
MDTSSLYGESFMDHVANPDYKYEMDAPTQTHRGVNPSCGDDLTLAIRLAEDGTIEEAAYTGSGCAVSQASADMMSDLMIGKTPAEARRLCQLFGQMIRGEQSDDNLLEEELDEASCLKSISRMPARVKCAELAWNTLDEMLLHGGKDA